MLRCASSTPWLFDALNAQRVARGLSWQGVADEIWELSEELNKGVGELADATDDLGRVLDGAKLIVVALPGSAHREVAERCAPLVEDGQTVFVSSNTGMGSLKFATAFRESGRAKDVLCAEYSGGAVGGRLLGPGVVNRAADFAFGIQHHGLRVGVFPALRTDEAMDIIHQAYPGAPAAENCLAAALSNRAVQHQAVVTLMGAVAIDHLSYLDITSEGQTPSTLKVSGAVDEERKAIQRAWGFDAPELFAASHRKGEGTDWDRLPTGPTGRVTREYRMKYAWKDRLDMQHRFVAEAVPYGHVFRASVAAKVGRIRSRRGSSMRSSSRAAEICSRPNGRRS